MEAMLDFDVLSDAFGPFAHQDEQYPYGEAYMPLESSNLLMSNGLPLENGAFNTFPGLDHMVQPTQGISQAEQVEVIHQAMLDVNMTPFQAQVQEGYHDFTNYSLAPNMFTAPDANVPHFQQSMSYGYVNPRQMCQSDFGAGYVQNNVIYTPNGQHGPDSTGWMPHTQPGQTPHAMWPSHHQSNHQYRQENVMSMPNIHYVPDSIIPSPPTGYSVGGPPSTGQCVRRPSPTGRYVDGTSPSRNYIHEPLPTGHYVDGDDDHLLETLHNVAALVAHNDQSTPVATSASHCPVPQVPPSRVSAPRATTQRRTRRKPAFSASQQDAAILEKYNTNVHAQLLFAQAELEDLQNKVLNRLGSCGDAAAAEALNLGLRSVLENSCRRDRAIKAIKSVSTAIEIEGKSRGADLRRRNSEAYVAKQEEESLHPKAKKGKQPGANKVRKSSGYSKGKSGNRKPKTVSPSSALPDDSGAAAAIATASDESEK